MFNFFKKVKTLPIRVKFYYNHNAIGFSNALTESNAAMIETYRENSTKNNLGRRVFILEFDSKKDLDIFNDSGFETQDI